MSKKIYIIVIIVIITIGIVVYLKFNYQHINSYINDKTTSIGHDQAGVLSEEVTSNLDSVSNTVPISNPIKYEFDGKIIEIISIDKVQGRTEGTYKIKVTWSKDKNINGEIIAKYVSEKQLDSKVPAGTGYVFEVTYIQDRNEYIIDNVGLAFYD